MMNGNKKIAVNSLVIFVRLCVVSIISLVAARVILQALGASDFGLYNVVGGIVLLLNVVNTAMVATTYRYIAYELGKGDKGNPNKIFNASFAIHVGFSIFILILGLTIGLFYVNNYLNVEIDKLSDARFVFFISIITTMISTIFVPFSGLLVAYERFHVPAIIDIISNIIKLGLLFLLLYYDGNRLRLYSLIMLLFCLMQNMLIYLYSRVNFYNVIRLNITRDKKLYHEMLHFSGWILFGACSSVVKTQGSAMIVNFFFGTIVNAAFAIATQIEHFILMFARSLNNAAIPQITKNYSGGNEKRSIILSCYISKYTFILMSFVAFPILLEIDFILSLWLKEVPEGTAAFCQLMILGALIGCMGEGIPALVQASGKIKIFQMVLTSIFMIGLPIAIILYNLNCPPYTILIVYCIISIVIAIVRLYLLKRILNMDIGFFVKTSYLKMLYMIIPMIVIYSFYTPNNFTVTQHWLGLCFLVFFVVFDVLLLGTDKREKQLIISYVKNIRRKGK